MFGVHNNGAARHFVSRYCFKFELFYSTTTTAVNATTIFVRDFLVESLGFSREDAISTSSKVKTRLKLKTNNPDSVVSFFEKVGINKSQIKTLVSASPSLLFSDVDKTLKPKIEILQELGLSEYDLAKFVTKNASFFTRGLNTIVRPNLDYLCKLLHDHDSVAKAIMKEPWLLSKNLSAVMPPNITLLQNLGFSSMDIDKVFLYKPRVLLSDTELLANAAHRVENIFHIPRKSPMFIHGIVALASVHESTLKMKLEIFRSFGWPDSDIYTMVQRLPYCLATSEAKLRSGLKFFMKELGYESSYLASRPTLLMLSFEKRVVPRNDIFKLLKEKQLIKSSLRLYGFMQCPEVKFLNKYVLPFRDELPEVYDIYMKSK